MEFASVVAERVEHQRLRVSESDEESDGWVAIASAPPKNMQQQLRSVRLMSAASVLLGIISVVMMTSVFLRSMSGPQSSISPSSLVGLNVVPESGEQEMQGWYRSYLDCQVSTEEGLDSELSDVLHAGSLVYVAETHGRRALILKPVKGWISVETADGITILSPDMTYNASPNKTDIGALFRSRQVREANERLQQVSMKVAAVEKKLMDTLKKVRDVPRHVEEKLARERLAHRAALAFHRTVETEGSNNILKHAAQNRHVQHVMRSSKVKNLVKEAKRGMNQGEDSWRDEAKLEASFHETSNEVAETSQRLADKAGYTV